MLLDKPVKEDGVEANKDEPKEKTNEGSQSFFFLFFFYVVDHFELGALCGFIIYVYVQVMD